MALHCYLRAGRDTELVTETTTQTETDPEIPIHGLIKEYTLHYIGISNMIEGIFLHIAISISISVSVSVLISIFLNSSHIGLSENSQA